MKQLFKYLKLARHKPGIIARGAKGLLLANVFKKDALRGVDVAITYQCQATCEKCSTKNLIEPGRPEMSKDEIIALSGKISSMGALLINLTGGEPLLKDGLIDIIEELNKLPLIISLSTLGFAMTDALMENLKRAGLNAIQISLSSPIEKEHDGEVGLSGSYRKVFESIKKARELGIEVLINTVITREKLHSDRIEKLVAIARENESLLSFILPAEVGGWQEKKVCLIREDHELIEKWLALDCVTIDTKTCYRSGRCPAGTEKVYVTAYGDVYPCPFIHKKYGNVLVDDFQKLWQNMSTDRSKSPCKGCWNVKGR